MIIPIPTQELPRILWLAQTRGTEASGRYIDRITQNLQHEQNAEVIPFPRRDMTPKPAA